MRNNSWLKEHEFFGLFQSPGTHNYRPADPFPLNIYDTEEQVKPDGRIDPTRLPNTIPASGYTLQPEGARRVAEGERALSPVHPVDRSVREIRWDGIYAPQPPGKPYARCVGVCR